MIDFPMDDVLVEQHRWAPSEGLLYLLAELLQAFERFHTRKSVRDFLVWQAPFRSTQATFELRLF